jgi:hypothetical protein
MEKGSLVPTYDYLWKADGIDDLKKKIKQELETNSKLNQSDELNNKFTNSLQNFIENLNDESSTSKEESTSTDEIPIQEQIRQLLLDSRIGIDRKKIEQIEEEMKRVEADTTLTQEEKQIKLAALKKEIENLIETAKNRSVELEKRKAILTAEQHSYELLSENRIKSML